MAGRRNTASSWETGGVMPERKEKDAVKRRGAPLLGKERRKVASIRIEPKLEHHAVSSWGSLSTAVNELLRAHLSRRRRP